MPVHGFHFPRAARELHSLRTRLLASFALLVVLALAMAGAVFVFIQHGASNRQSLDRLAAAAPEISLELRVLNGHGAGPQEIGEYIHQVSRDRDVRVLVVDRRDGSVVDDSHGTLQGRRLSLPPPGSQSSETAYRSIYQSWRGTDPGTKNLTFLTAAYGRVGRPFPAKFGAGANDLGTNEIAVLAVPRNTIANSWLGLLPGLLWAGLAALALSVLMAMLLSRSIARPVLALTRASEAVAKGHFDQEVPHEGPDEIGRLAGAFNSMAREVGRSNLQTRALIADVSHDLKTPLTSILGFAQALRDGAAQDPAEVQELSGIIHEEAEHIFSIVEGLLYLSEIEAGEIILNQDPVNLADLAARCLRRLEPSLRERQITIEALLEPSTAVIGDADKLERILDNLLDNARKYTPAGGQLMVSVGRWQADAALSCLQVHNSGSYIPAEELSKLFDRFYRMDRSRGGAPRGSGLGLAIVKELVELHRGTVTVESDPRGGTTFQILLPALVEPPSIRPRDAATSAEGSGARQPWSASPAPRGEMGAAG